MKETTENKKITRIITKTNTQEANEECWETGTYSDDCDCSICDYKHDCSGSDSED